MSNKAPLECANEKSNMTMLEGMPRDQDTFWRTDWQLPRCHHSGQSVFHDNLENKSTAFTHQERQVLSIHGLMPARVCTLEQQVDGCAKFFGTLTTDLQKYLFLVELQSTNRQLFYNLLLRDPERFMSVIDISNFQFSVENYSLLVTSFHGMFVTIKDRGHIYDVLRNYPKREAVRYVVITNGEVVMSMGDHGANAAPAVFDRVYANVIYGGMPPDICLPVVLDVGTNNERLLRDPFYIGVREHRVSGPEFADFFEEFTLAVIRLFGPRTIIQTQNLSSLDASRLLERYRERQCFIDISLQCRGACGLAGLLAANRINNDNFKNNKLIFYGNSAFNIGMARLCIAYLKRQRLDENAARTRIWFFDEHGLLVHGRCEHRVPEELAEFKQHHEPITDLVEAIDKLKPNVLVGNCSQPGVFTKEVLRAMEQSAQQPIIYAMGNPWPECSADDAYVYTKGRCIFISSRRLPPLKYANKWYQPGYCNSIYIHSGLTLGVILSGMTSVPDETFLVAADLLPNLVWPNDLAKRDMFPPRRKLKCVNFEIAQAVFSFAYRRRLASLWPEPANPRTYIASMLYKPDYESVIQPMYCTEDFHIGTAESEQQKKLQK